jgi:hyperosmotically inducible protein
MDTSGKGTLRALQIVAASVFALTLGACDQKPSADRISKDVERSLDQANRQIEQAGKETERKFDQAGKALDDATLTTKVKTALISEPGLKSGEINVETSSGIVTLQGTADTIENRQKAAQVASNVEGVRAVKNQIVVRGT